MTDTNGEERDERPGTGMDDPAEPVRPDLDIALHRRGTPAQEDDPSAAALRSMANPAAGV